VYDGCMTPEEELSKAMEAFFRRTKEDRRLPDDLLVPKYREWTGPEPVPCDDYRVQYEDGIRKEADNLRLRDSTLQALRRFLDFAVDEKSKVLRVFRLVKGTE
jgi:hypothetical protein